jgi:mono/diheme cytochrome c family protein
MVLSRTWLMAQKWMVLFLGFLLSGTVTIAAANEVKQGRALYVENCAPCHGLSGQGDGPLARELSTPPGDLRTLAERYGNPLPEDQVGRFIDGRADVKAHGPRDMPVWGKRFYMMDGGRGLAEDRIRELVAYLQSIQTNTAHASAN